MSQGTGTVIFILMYIHLLLFDSQFYLQYQILGFFKYLEYRAHMRKIIQTEAKEQKPQGLQTQE